MSADIAEIKAGMEEKVDCDVFETVKKRNETMWDERNKIIGYLLACGVIGGTTGALVKQFVMGVFAK